MKNKNTYYLALIILLGLSLFSCKKEKTEDEQGQNNDNTATCRIKKITDNNGESTDFTYNSDKKLIQITSGPTDPTTMDFTYDANGNLATMHIVDNIGSDATTTFSYSNGVVSSATVTEAGQVQVQLAYHYSNTKLHDIELSRSGVVYVKTVFFYNGDNVSKMEEYYIDMTGSLALTNTTTYQYDNKKNPLYELGITAAIINEGHADFASKNNITGMTKTGNTSGTETITYQYNSNNYPTEGTSSIEGTATMTYYPCE